MPIYQRSEEPPDHLWRRPVREVTARAGRSTQRCGERSQRLLCFRSGTDDHIPIAREFLPQHRCELVIVDTEAPVFDVARQAGRLVGNPARERPNRLRRLEGVQVDHEAGDRIHQQHELGPVRLWIHHPGGHLPPYGDQFPAGRECGQPCWSLHARLSGDPRRALRRGPRTIAPFASPGKARGAAGSSRSSASTERGAGAGSSDPILISRHARVDAAGETPQLSDGLGGDHLDPVLETKDDQLLAGLEAQGLPDVSRSHDLELRRHFDCGQFSPARLVA